MAGVPRPSADPNSVMAHVRLRWRRYLIFAIVLIGGIVMCMAGGEGERLFELGAGIVSGSVVALAVFAIDFTADRRHRDQGKASTSRD
jgi:hypothetical protein